jgi:hypothetical protein
MKYYAQMQSDGQYSPRSFDDVAFPGSEPVVVLPLADWERLVELTSIPMWPKGNPNALWDEVRTIIKKVQP